MKISVTTPLFLIFALLSTNLHAQVNYEEEIQPIFTANCVSCHGGTSGVTLSSYSAVMNSVGTGYETKIVVPGEPDQSPLVDKIEPNPDIGSRMPQGNALSDEEINLIRSWIEEGANEVPVSNEVVATIPEGFEMEGNFPNPFNPQTVITFQAPQKANYSLYVYNSVGVLVREVSGLANAPRTQVSMTFNDLPSGIYIYTVKITLGTTSFYLDTRKMALVK